MTAALLTPTHVVSEIITVRVSAAAPPTGVQIAASGEPFTITAVTFAEDAVDWIGTDNTGHPYTILTAHTAALVPVKVTTRDLSDAAWLHIARQFHPTDASRCEIAVMDGTAVCTSHGVTWDTSGL